MDIFLFLYPVTPYFMECLGLYPTFIKNEYSMDILNKVIDARYRARGFEIYWLFFSQNGDPGKPDLQLKYKEINISEKDTIIPSGNTLRQTNQRIYPEPKTILAKLPVNVNKLVLGGFHAYDCVERVAKYAHGIGVDTHVDLDTTELFVASMITWKGEMPIDEETVFPTGDVHFGDRFYDMMRHMGKGQPWLKYHS